MNKYNLQIKTNNGVNLHDYWKGNGVYTSYVELDIEGKHLLIYHFQHQFWLEVDLVPQLNKRVSIDGEDMYGIEYDNNKFFRYVNQIIDTYIEENKINYMC